MKRPHQTATRDGVPATGDPRSGMALWLLVTMLLALAVLAGTAALVSLRDTRTAKASLRISRALEAAEAGTQWVHARMEDGLVDGTLVPTGAIVNVAYTGPASCAFSPVTQLFQTSNTNAYRFTVTGTNAVARCVLELVVTRASALEMGLFGDEEVDLKASGNVYSYHSGQVPVPMSSDSTGESLMGSNGDFLTHQDTFIDGSFELGGAADGTAASWRETPVGGSDIAGEAGTDTERVDPDPLGVVSGSLAAAFSYYSAASNNENSVVGVPPNNQLRVNSGSFTLGSGNYYLTGLILGQGATLNIDSSGGPVSLYMTGKLEAKNGSSIHTGGRPADLRIYSNSSQGIVLKNSGDFAAVIYAPLADVAVMNSGDFYGLAWGSTLELKNSGNVFMDMDALQAFPGNKMQLISWKEQR